MKTAGRRKNAVLDAVPGADITYLAADLSHLSEVERAAARIGEILDARSGGRLDVLINNAGGVRSGRIMTPDGFEFQFALNYLSGFLLTHRLFPYLKKCGGRVIMTGSNSHQHTRIHWNNILYGKRYNCLMAYKQSKLCVVMFAKEFNRRFEPDGLRAYVVDPGLVNTNIGNKQTRGIEDWFWSLHKKRGVPPEVPAQTYVYLCGEAPATGVYYYQCAPRRYNWRADRVCDTKRLFELSERLCKINFGNGQETAQPNA